MNPDTLTTLSIGNQLLNRESPQPQGAVLDSDGSESQKIDLSQSESVKFGIQTQIF